MKTAVLSMGVAAFAALGLTACNAQYSDGTKVIDPAKRAVATLAGTEQGNVRCPKLEEDWLDDVKFDNSSKYTCTTTVGGKETSFTVTYDGNDNGTARWKAAAM